MPSPVEHPDFEPLQEDEKALYALYQQTQEKVSEQRVQTVMEAIRREVTHEQSSVQTSSKVQEIAESIHQIASVFFEETFYPMAAADNDNEDEPIERTSANGEITWVSTEDEIDDNIVFITINVSPEYIKKYEGRKAVVSIGDQTVLSELIEDGVADITLDKSKHPPIDTEQLINIRIE